MKTDSKVLDWSRDLERALIADWSDVVLCYGHFDAIHPGHLRYFQFAREHGTRLVVAVEGDDQQAIKGSGRSRFPASERARAVAALYLVDYVVVVTPDVLIELIEATNFTALVLGREFEDEEGGQLLEVINFARQKGISVLFTAGEAHYATVAFFDKPQRELEVTRWREFQAVLRTRGIQLPLLMSRLVKSDRRKILVVGDTIVDRYVACDPVGLSSESPTIVVKELQSRDFVGGAAIVAAHIASLGTKCDLISVVGEDVRAEFLREQMSLNNVTAHLLSDDSRPTTFKIRYMIENQKLFRVSSLKDHRLAKDIESNVIDRIKGSTGELSAIVVSDFVYGVITPRILSAITEISKEFRIPLFGDLQCSSQIGNVGKFKEFDLLFPTEREARVALNNQDAGVEEIAKTLMKDTHVPRLIMKLGGDGLITYDSTSGGESLDRQHFPALSVNPIDVAGAGDALLATIAVGISKGLSLTEATAVGCCGAALAVETVGNIPVRLENVVEFSQLRGNP